MRMMCLTICFRPRPRLQWLYDLAILPFLVLPLHSDSFPSRVYGILVREVRPTFGRGGRFVYMKYAIVVYTA